MIAAVRLLVWLLAAAYASVAVATGGGSRAGGPVGDLLFLTLLAVVVAMAAVALGRRAVAPALRPSATWWLAAWTVPLLGMARLVFAPLFPGGAAPAWLSLIYVVGYPCWWMALARWPTDTAPSSTVVARLLDRALLVAVAALVTIVTITAARSEPDLSLEIRLLGVLLPIGDLVSLLYAATKLDATRHPAHRRALVWLGAVLPFDLVVDLYYSTVVPTTGPMAKLLVALAYAVPPLLIAQAVVETTRPATAHDAPTSATAPVPITPVVAIAVVVALVLAAVTGLASFPLVPVLLGATAIAVLGTARQLVALRAMTVAVEERDRAQARLRQAETLQVVGRLAAGIAHDFNNLLAVVRGGADQLAQEPLAAPARDVVDQVAQAATRGSALTRRLLALTRDDAPEARPTPVDATLRELRPLVERLMVDGITVQLDLDAPDASILIDPVEFERACINLAVNARDAMPRGGTLTLRTRTAEGRLRLEIEDTGIGMDAATRARLFQPLFTTKGAEQGTGLGLHTTAGIVQSARGTIRVESAPGQGTRFSLEWPCTMADGLRDRPTAGADPRPGPVSGAAPAAAALILLVEDEPAVRAMTVRALARQGYRTTLAADVDEAVRRLEDPAAEPPAAVLTDVVMPGRSGLELVQWVRRERPQLPVVVMSGYVPDGPPDAPGVLHGVPLLHKPFAAAELGAQLAAVLDRPAPTTGAGAR